MSRDRGRTIQRKCPYCKGVRATILESLHGPTGRKKNWYTCLTCRRDYIASDSQRRPTLEEKQIPLFDPRAAFGDPNSEETKRFREKYGARRRGKVERDITGMVRRDNPGTSAGAAHVVLPHVTKLQRQVLEAFNRHGPMTDEELEELPQFSLYGPTTVKKRRTELYQCDRVERRSIKRNSRGVKMIVWSLTPKGVVD